MPDPDRLLRTLYKAADAVRQTPGRKGRFVQLQDADEVVVSGDLHGHVSNFQELHRAADLANNPRRHLVLQEVVHGTLEYPLGGDKSHQILDLFSALKCQFPRQVHLLMGNHELAQWTNNKIMKNDRDLNTVFIAGVNEAYGEKGPDIYNGYLRLFGTLPLALRTANRIFISHSLPREKFRDRFELRLLETDAFPAEDLTVGGIVYELVWGRDTRPQNLLPFLKKTECDYLVSGHILCDPGFAMPSPNQLIVDCCNRPAGYALLNCTHPLTPEEFQACVRMI
jgi:hypothetical protein